VRKYALLGAGKTGGKVVDLALDSEEVIIFNTSNPPTVEKLAEVDAIISFLPGPAFVEYLDVLLASNKPVITGSTGFDWPADIHQKLVNKKVTWIKTHNFALGMNVIKPIIEYFQKAGNLFPEAQYKMHEVHHTKKLDAPSGTALSWKDWLDRNVEITHDRIGDVVGDHELTLRTEFEEITIKHRSLDRKIFASGALWATRYILDNGMDHGLHPLEVIAKKRMQEN
jgi:4-hydroxy-tetrahydrodipicolinate reductase